MLAKTETPLRFKELYSGDFTHFASSCATSHLHAPIARDRARRRSTRPLLVCHGLAGIHRYVGSVTLGTKGPTNGLFPG
ncbi:MAG: hypothetical protein GAK28_02043 [Luteibacter sp.]|nr:MAG: hypothetical protein GAK28_02043 [Luteibacter sp.]